MTKHHSEQSTRGFTLVEILVVVTILGILSAIVGTNLHNRKAEADRQTTAIQIAELGKSLELYRLKFHRFPSTAEGLGALIHPPQGLPIIDTLPRDAWDLEFVYVAPGTHNVARYDLASRGSDGEPDTPDDVTNWTVEVPK